MTMATQLCVNPVAVMVSLGPLSLSDLCQWCFSMAVEEIDMGREQQQLDVCEGCSGTTGSTVALAYSWLLRHTPSD